MSDTTTPAGADDPRRTPAPPAAGAQDGRTAAPDVPGAPTQPVPPTPAPVGGAPDAGPGAPSLTGGPQPTGPYLVPPPAHAAGASFGPFRVAAPAAAAAPKPPLTVRRGAAVGVVGAALAVGLVAGGGTAWAVAATRDDATRPSFSDADWPGRPGDGELPALPDRSGPRGWSDDGSDSSGSSDQDDTSGDTGTTSAQTTTAATADQQVGVVTITSTLGYQGGSSAGTGMVLTTGGLVLTNHHVVEGATAISVTVESTGETFEATVVGYDASADVALLQLTGASGLATVALDDDGGVAQGDTVTAVGNADGTGQLVAAAGRVTGTDETMTARTSTAGGAQTLSGLLEFSAAVVGGDSGGPVLDEEGEVVGITTAASVGGTATVAYAIDVVDAVAVAQQISSGEETATVRIGYPAFLGIGLDAGAGTVAGARVAGVLDGTPAAGAGLAAGDVVTAVDGTAVSSATALQELLDGYAPGDSVTLTWTDPSTGASEQATVTLTQGPVG